MLFRFFSYFSGMNIDSDIFKIQSNNVLPSRGRILISEPFLRDATFGLEARLVEGNGLGLPAGQVVGKVVDVIDSPAQSLLKIRLTEPVVPGQNSKGEDVVEKTALVPFVEALVPDIDLEEQYLTLDPPGGLIPGL